MEIASFVRLPSWNQLLGMEQWQRHQFKKGIAAAFLFALSARRRRLLDQNQDNLAEKYHVDLLRYAGVISGDAPGTTKIEVRQEKVGSKEPETTVIEVYRL